MFLAFCFWFFILFSCFPLFIIHRVNKILHFKEPIYETGEWMFVHRKFPHIQLQRNVSSTSVTTNTYHVGTERPTPAPTLSMLYVRNVHTGQLSPENWFGFSIQFQSSVNIEYGTLEVILWLCIRNQLPACYLMWVTHSSDYFSPKSFTCWEYFGWTEWMDVICTVRITLHTSVR